MAENVASLLMKVEEPTHERITASFNIQLVSSDQQLATGQVYAPNAIDTHGHYMEPADVIATAHAFMENSMLHSIDVQHEHKLVDAVVVESFIARKDDPTFDEGAWVVTTKINDPELWALIKTGAINAYSFEILTHKDDVDVEIEYQAWYYGFTDPDPEDGHDHPYLLRIDPSGSIIWGQTGVGSDGSPAHTISNQSVTDAVDGKTHRLHLD